MAWNSRKIPGYVKSLEFETSTGKIYKDHPASSSSFSCQACKIFDRFPSLFYVDSQMGYDYLLLQNGTLPLSPDGSFDAAVEHKCTAVLLWPENEPPTRDNTIAVDPCFTAQGFDYATAQLERYRLSFRDIGWVFVTHYHRDHLPNVAQFTGYIKFRRFRPDAHPGFAGLTLVPQPGHAPDLRALVFVSPTAQKVYLVGDAILNSNWLKAWGYYWPNGYTEADIAQTWASVAAICAAADLIIPGHGQPIPVTAALVQELLTTFAQAKHANACPHVEPLLRTRLAELERDDLT